MEMVGTEVEALRTLKKHKDTYNNCIGDLNTLFREAENVGYDFTRGKYFDGETWVGDFNPHTMVESCVSQIAVIQQLVWEEGVEVELCGL